MASRNAVRCTSQDGMASRNAVRCTRGNLPNYLGAEKIEALYRSRRRHVYKSRPLYHSFGTEGGFSRRTSTQDGTEGGLSRRTSTQDGTEGGFSRHAPSRSGTAGGFSQRAPDRIGTEGGFSQRVPDRIGTEGGFSRRGGQPCRGEAMASRRRSCCMVNVGLATAASVPPRVLAERRGISNSCEAGQLTRNDARSRQRARLRR